MAYWLYIERIVAGEEKFPDQAFPGIYADYAARTPAFVPRLGLWTGPAESFSLRTVLRREYNGVLSVVAVVFALEFVADVLMEREGVRAWMEREGVRAWMEHEWWWVAIGAFALALFSVLRGLKKHTRVLHVPGRWSRVLSDGITCVVARRSARCYAKGDAVASAERRNAAGARHGATRRAGGFCAGDSSKPCA